TQSDVQNGAHSTTLYFPILKLGQGWQVSISLTNLESEEVEVALTIYDTHGFSLGEIAGVIQAGGTTTLDAQSLPFGAASLKVGSNGRLVGHALLRTTDGKKLEAIPAIKETSQELYFPALAEDDAFYKIITLLNPNDTLASVTIVALDENGDELNRIIVPSLSSMESRSLLLADIFSSGVLESLSVIKVESDSKIIGLQLVDFPEGDLVGLPALTTNPAFALPESSAQMQMRWPVDGTPNWNNDYASFNRVGNKMHHTGVDIGGVRGATIRAAATGVIRPGYVYGLAPPRGGLYEWWVWNDKNNNEKWDSGEEEGPFRFSSGDNHGLGMTIIIEHNVGGQVFYSLYGHLDDVTREIYDTVVRGSQPLTVRQGQPIGLMGFSNYDRRESSNIHVHFELKTHSGLGDSQGRFWGYTPDLPQPYGYIDPTWLIDPPGSPQSLSSPTAFEVLEDVAIRAGPRRNFAVLGLLSRGQKFVGRRILRVSRSEEWVEIDIPNERGPAVAWVAKRFNNADFLGEDSSATIVRVIGQVRLRSGPSTSNPQLQVWDNVRSTPLDVFIHPTTYFVSSRTQTGTGSTQPWHEIDVPNIYDRDPANTSRVDEPVGGEAGRQNPGFKKRGDWGPKAWVAGDLIEPVSGGDGGCAVTPISTGQTVSGSLSTSDCRSPVRGSSYYADRYSFSASAGQQVAILLTSSAFDTYLYLIGPDGSVIARDDDGGGGTNSRIPSGSGFYSLPSSGTYIIEVTSFYSNSTGDYTLSLTGSGGDGGCAVTPISIGQTVSGSLSMSDCRSLVRGNSYYADRYLFSGNAGQRIAISLDSSDFDTYLYLLDSNNSVIAQDDDGGPGLNSRIPPGSGFFSLPYTGTYVIEVTSYSGGATGTYSLTLSSEGRPSGGRRTVFLIHGIRQTAASLRGLVNTLRDPVYGIDQSRFVIDAEFDYSDCADTVLCDTTTCIIQNAARALAQYINSRNPQGDIILIGYSLGGLVARDMMLNNYSDVFANRRVAALITLGTPNVGYPYIPIDELAACGSYLRQMASDYRERQSERIVVVSEYLYDLITRWGSSEFLGRPGVWLTAAGTSCDDPTRYPGFGPGCPDHNPRSDGVVCEQSASFRVRVQRNTPTDQFTDPDHAYSHSGSLGSWLVLCSGSGYIPLDNPIASGSLVRKIKEVINNLP
ncbi:MAG: pre-peptidase C-terminal domain-containing protein, partial [Candidatus Methanosuratincola sp.]